MARAHSSLALAAAVLVIFAPSVACEETAGEQAGALSAAEALPGSTDPDSTGAGPALTDMGRDMLRICEGVVELFSEHADDIWPGYDLSAQPFLVYIPGEFALLLNCGDGAEGFEPYPGDWPAVCEHACYAGGQVDNLVGQLVFGYDAGGVRTVAIGFPESVPPAFEDLELRMLGFVVHEAFHEYQDRVFGEIEWAREQQYPIEDIENSALAYLEMATLVDAVEAAWADDTERLRGAASQFVAVRSHRWDRAGSFVRTYEGGKETREGTARYVELRCLDLARGLEYETSVTGTPPLPAQLGKGALPASLLRDFRDSMVDGAVPIEDLRRNRIYPVASAQGFLLDHLGADWKAEVRLATAQFTYARILADELGLQEEAYPRMLEEAKARYGYPDLLEAAGRVLGGHRSAYDEAITQFEAQGGTRLEITFDTNGLYRSRSSSARRIVIDRGVHEFCDHYDVYTLERDGTFFELHDAALLEVNDYGAKRKTVVFLVPGIPAIEVDGEDLAVPPAQESSRGDHDAPRSASRLRVAGEGFELTHEGPGTIGVGPGRIEVDLTGSR